MIIPELPNYLESIGGKEYKAYFITLFTLAALISRPFSGKLADKVGRIPIMIVGALVCTVIGVLYPLISTVFGFLMLRFLHGFSTGFKPTGTTAYLADISPPQKRGEAMGILGVAGSIGMAGGPVLGSYLAQTFSVNTMFLVSPVIALLSILVLAGMKETLPNPQKFSFNFLKLNPNELVEPRVWLPSLIMFLGVFSFGIVITISQDFSDHLGLTNRGLFFSIFLTASMAVRLFSGKASDRYGRLNIMIIGIILLALGMFVIGWSQNLTTYVIGAIIYGTSAGLNSPTLFAWAADLGYEKARGKAMSTLFIALESGIMIGSYFGATIYNNNSNNFKYAFWSGTALSLVALGVLLYQKIKVTEKA